MIVVRDEEIVQKALDEMPLPEQVERLITEFGSDWAGDPAVFVWVVYRDEATSDRARFLALKKQVREAIEETVARTGSDRWTYVRVRTASEHREIEREMQRELQQA